jgi:cyclohexanone monooxygenase
MTSTRDGATSLDAAALRAKYMAERDKRLRADTDGQFLEATGDYAEFARDPYIEAPLERDAITQHIDVAVIGGGFGGLLTAVKLRDAGVDDFRIIEQGGDFGGTWYWNRYPGVRCDIEAYVYMPLLEEIGTVPSERYATGAEIFAHCQAIGRRYRLYENALLQTTVIKIAWDDARARWLVETDRGDRIHARHVAVSQGPLAKVKLPGVPGIKSFGGRIFHSSRWDYDYTGGDAFGGHTKLRDKRVAVVGTGATAVQIVPTIAENTGRLYVVQRTPSAVGPRNNTPTDTSWFNTQRPGWQADRMNNFLSVITMQPNAGDQVKDCWTDFFVRAGAAMKDNAQSGANKPPSVVIQSVDYAKMDEIRDHIASVVSDAQLAQALKPWYNYLCKRPLFSDDFLQAFNRENVSLVDTDGKGLEAITETGIVVNGEEIGVDCIIFATGFDVGATPEKVGGYDLRGRGGMTLDAKWADGYRSVHGMLLSGFPNFYIVGGHIQGAKAFNFTHTLAMQAEHAVDLIARCVGAGVETFEATPQAELRWLKEIEAKQVDQAKFNEDCTPGFLNNEGNFRAKGTFIGVTYGGGPLAWERIVREWRSGEGLAQDTVVTYPATRARAEA